MTETSAGSHDIIKEADPSTKVSGQYVPVIVGVVVAFVATLSVLGTLYFCFWRKRKKGQDAESTLEATYPFPPFRKQNSFLGRHLAPQWSLEQIPPSEDSAEMSSVGNSSFAAGQHEGGDSGLISPAGAATSHPHHGYNRDTEPDGVSHGSMDGSQLFHGSIQLMDDLLQMSAQHENEDEQLEMENQQEEDTERRDDPEGREDRKESEEDKDDSESDEEIREISFIRTEAAAQLEQPTSQFADQKPSCLDENLQNNEVDLCNFLGKTSAEEIVKEEKNDMEKMDRDASDSETESEPKPLEESDSVVPLTTETNAIEDECQGEVESLVPTVKNNANDDASHIPEETLSSLESQCSAPSSLESQPGNGINLESQNDNEIHQESHNDVWSEQLQADVKETEEACQENSLSMDSFSTDGGPDRVCVPQLDGPEESGCLVPKGREMPSPREAVLAVIDMSMSAVTIMEEDGKENGFDHRIDNKSTSPTFNHNLESNNHVIDEREIMSSPEAAFIMNDNGPMGVAPIMEEEKEIENHSISPDPISMDEESAPLIPEVTESPSLLPKTPCLNLEEMDIEGVDFTKNDCEITIPILEHSDDMKDLIESESISPGATEPFFVHEPEASVDPGPEDSVQNDDVSMGLKTPAMNFMQGFVQGIPSANLSGLSVPDDYVNLSAIRMPDVNLSPIGIPYVNLSAISMPDVNLSAISMPHVNLSAISMPHVNLSAMSMPHVNLSAISMPHVNLSAMSMPHVNLSAMSVSDLDSISVPDVNVIPATLTRTISPSLKQKQSKENASGDKPNKTKAKGPTASKAPTSKAPSAAPKRTNPAKPAPGAFKPGAAKPGAAKPATKPLTAATKTATAAAATRTATTMPKIPTTSAKTRAAPRPTTTTTRTTTATSRPTAAPARPTTAPSKPATSKPATASSRPATALSRPATTSSRPVTESSRPATASSRPATASSRPVTVSSRPATASSRPATASSKPATASSIPAPAGSRPATASSIPAPAGSRHRFI